MTILVTGAAGFLGTRLIRTLLADPAHAGARIVAADITACPVDDPRIDCRIGTIADPEFVGAIAHEAAVVYHLAAVLSGQAESEFDLGMQINVDATRALLEACRRLTSAPRFVFTSTVAVFGGTLPPIVPEDMALLPQSSYGTAKAIVELLVSDYSRRGFVDGVICRVPTVAVRPGRPNAAASSFVSGIIREPLAGIESVCPVPPDTRLWISSPETVTRNLAHAGSLPAAELGGRRAVNLPGITVTPEEMLDALGRLGGPDARARVRLAPDDRIIRIVCSWPGAFDVSRARQLGFQIDRDFDAILRQFMAERGLMA